MSPLSDEPDASVSSLSELVGIARAMEEESARRYRQLGALMRSRGEMDTAATFDALVAEEQSHIDTVLAWGERLVGAVPEGSRFVWRLPPDIARSWDEIAGSALLTPYRVLSIAVENEETAFAYYAYIAAGAADEALRTQAELLAAEELGHATLLRRERRKAYHRERAAAGARSRRPAGSLAELEAAAAPLLREVALRHEVVARLLEEAGDADSARLLRADAAPAGVTAPDRAITGETASDPVRLLRHALQPVEALAELYEDAAAHAPTVEVLDAAQHGLERSVALLARIAARIGQAGAR